MLKGPGTGLIANENKKKIGNARDAKKCVLLVIFNSRSPAARQCYKANKSVDRFSSEGLWVDGLDAVPSRADGRTQRTK